MYFNRKYKRVGPLFQSLYKAVRVVSDEQIQHLSRYIHRNPSSLLASQGTSLHDYPYSSYSEYIGKRDTEWVRKLRILEYFSGSSKSYQSFVEQKDDDIFWEILNPLVFEDGI
jgi:putative transposase